MRLSRQMHHTARGVLVEHLAHGGSIGDIGLHMHVSCIVLRHAERLEMARVREQIDVHHAIRALGDEQAHERRADEARAAGHEQGLDLVALVVMGHGGVA